MSNRSYLGGNTYVSWNGKELVIEEEAYGKFSLDVEKFQLLLNFIRLGMPAVHGFNVIIVADEDLPIINDVVRQLGEYEEPVMTKN